MDTSVSRGTLYRGKECVSRAVCRECNKCTTKEHRLNNDNIGKSLLIIIEYSMFYYVYIIKVDVIFNHIT